MSDSTRLCVLLLPGVLEELPFAERARDLLRSPAVVAVEPARIGVRRGGDLLAATQARRLRKHLPGVPHAVVVLDPRQYLLARALLARNPDCELWYGRATEPTDDRARELDTLASQRAALVFDPGAPQPDQMPFRANAELWDRLEERGIARR
jgi:hypothetical protein